EIELALGGSVRGEGQPVIDRRIGRQRVLVGSVGELGRLAVECVMPDPRLIALVRRVAGRADGGGQRIAASVKGDVPGKAHAVQPLQRISQFVHQKTCKEPLRGSPPNPPRRRGGLRLKSPKTGKARLRSFLSLPLYQGEVGGGTPDLLLAYATFGPKPRMAQG